VKKLAILFIAVVLVYEVVQEKAFRYRVFPYGVVVLRAHSRPPTTTGKAIARYRGRAW